MTPEEDNFTIVIFAFLPIVRLGMGRESVSAGATLRALTIFVKLMLCVWNRLKASGNRVSTPAAPGVACPNGSIFLSISTG